MKNIGLYFGLILICMTSHALRGWACETSANNESRRSLSSVSDSISMECRFSENPFVLTITFEFDDEATKVAVYRNYNQVENHTYEVWDGFSVSYDCSAYGEGDYIVMVSPKCAETGLMAMIGIADEQRSPIFKGMSQPRAQWLQKRNMGLDFCELGNLMMVHCVPQEEPVGFVCESSNQESVALRRVHSRLLSRLCVPADNSWINFHDRGLYTWEGSLAALDGVKKGDIVEFVYDSEEYNNRGEGCSQFLIYDCVSDVGDVSTSPRELSITKATKEDYGCAVYEIDEDGLIGFGLSGAGAIRQIIVYQNEGTEKIDSSYGNLQYKADCTYDYHGRKVKGASVKGLIIQGGKKHLRHNNKE